MNYSRRAFLGLTAAGVAGCASAKVGGDDAVAAFDENLSIIFSDAHVCGENERAANFTPKRLKAFVDEVLAMRPLPRRVIHLGDLASFDHIREARRLDKEIFVHHIFSKPELLDELAAMGNAGLSYNYKDLATVPAGLVECVHAKGVKMCLRAGDTPETVAAMVKMGLDYIPTNVTIPM